MFILFNEPATGTFYDVNEGIKSSFSTDALSDCCLNVMCCVRLFHVVDTKDWL